MLMDDMGDDPDEISFSEWPDPPGSHPWLPAYGFQPPQDHALEKEDFLDPADAALFLGSGCGGSGSGMAHFLETIVEETSEDLCSDGGSERPPCWLDDSDADSVIHVPQGKDECDSGSERDFLCPAKRRRPNQLRPECPPSPTDTISLSLSLSRSSSLAQFESLEQSCQLTDVSGPPSPISILSLDSLERLKGMQPTEISPDSLDNSSDSEHNSSSSQGSAYRLGSNRFNNGSVSESHFNDRSLPEERFCDETYIVQNGVKDSLGETNRSFFNCDEETRYWNAKVDRTNEGSSSSEFSDTRSSDSERTIHEQTVRAAEPRDPPLKYNFKSCRSLDALPSLENLDATKIDGGAFACPPRRKTSAPQYSVENLSEDSGYSDHFCNFLRMKSKSIPNVSKKNPAAAPCNEHSLKRKSDDDLPSLLVAKCQRKSEVGDQFGARGEFRPKVASPDVASARRRETAAAGGATVGTQITAGVFRSRRPEPSSSLPDLSAASRSDAAYHFDPKNARNTLPRATADRFARLLDEELNRDDGNLYSVSSVPKDLNLCDEPASADCAPSSLDDNWSFGSERAVSVAAKNFDLCDFDYPKRTNRAVIQEASFKQSFRVCDSFTTSVADLTVLDYRSDADGNAKNVLKKFSARTSKMARNLPPTRERSAESDSTTESEKVFLGEMQKTMRELSDQSKKILEKSLDCGNFDKNLSILTNKRLHSAFNPFDDVIAELEKKQARSKTSSTTPQQPAAPAYEFNYYGDDADPPYYRRHYELSNSNTETSSPDVSEAFGGDLFYHSTPVKGGDKVQSTPNLNTFNQDVEDLYTKVTPQDDMRSSMQHVPLKSEFKPVGILGSKSQGLSGSGSSKGVHFCPVVAEVSWRERSYSEDSTGEASSTSSAYSGVSDADRTGVFATAAPPPSPPVPPPLAAPRIALPTSSSPPALQHHQPQQKQQYPLQRPQAAPRFRGEGAHSTATPASPPGRSHTPTAGASAQVPNQNFPMERQKTPPRSRIGGFLSRFANFRFSTRRSSAKKKQDNVNKDSNNDPTPVKNDKLAPQTTKLSNEPTPISNGDKLKVVHQEKIVVPDKECPEYIYIPLKGKTAEGRPPLPPGRAPRSPLRVEGLLETDLDTETTRTVLVSSSRARSLLALPPPPPVPRSHKSMEYLLDKENLKCVEPPENDLQKNSADRVLSEHQLRVQRSLQKLNLPDWYKNSPVPREGFLLKKRASDAGSNSGRGWPQQQVGLGGKTTSLGSLGGGVPTRQLALTPPSQYQQPGFTRWSTSRLNSAQTSPCSSARSSVRCGAVSPLNSPARPPRVPRPTRPPYLGWRSQERLASPRTPHERLAVSLLPASPPVPANTTEEIQTSIKEVTSAIVHYVSGLEPGKEARPSSPRGSPRLCWVESSFVGTKPLESPQTPVVVSQLSPPHQQQINHHTASNNPTTNSNSNGHANHNNQHLHLHQHHSSQQQRPLQLELHSTSHGNPNTTTLAATTYQHGEYITTLT